MHHFSGLASLNIATGSCPHHHCPPPCHFHRGHFQNVVVLINFVSNELKHKKKIPVAETSTKLVSALLFNMLCSS